MPTYDYRCTACEHEFELFQSMTAKHKRKCPECGKSALERLIGTGAAVLFKGSGFYQTDYRSESYKKGAEKDKKASESKDSKSKSESGKSDSSKSKGDSGGACACGKKPAEKCAIEERRAEWAAAFRAVTYVCFATSPLILSVTTLCVTSVLGTLLATCQRSLIYDAFPLRRAALFAVASDISRSIS